MLEMQISHSCIHIYLTNNLLNTYSMLVQLNSGVPPNSPNGLLPGGCLTTSLNSNRILFPCTHLCSHECACVCVYVCVCITSFHFSYLLVCSFSDIFFQFPTCFHTFAITSTRLQYILVSNPSTLHAVFSFVELPICNIFSPKLTYTHLLCFQVVSFYFVFIIFLFSHITWRIIKLKLPQRKQLASPYA